jgi:hypothetical protein
MVDAPNEAVNNAVLFALNIVGWHLFRGGDDDGRWKRRGRRVLEAVKSLGHRVDDRANMRGLPKLAKPMAA